MTMLVARSRQRRLENQRLLVRSRTLLAISRRVLNPAWGVSGAADDMPNDPHHTVGMIYIDRVDGGAIGLRSPSYFLVSFGGEKDGTGTFYLGRVSGLGRLAALLTKVGVQPAEVDTALQTLPGQPHHQVPNVTLTPDVLRDLGL